MRTDILQQAQAIRASMDAAALEPWQAGTSYAKGAAFVHNGQEPHSRQRLHPGRIPAGMGIAGKLTSYNKDSIKRHCRCKGSGLAPLPLFIPSVKYQSSKTANYRKLKTVGI